MRKFIEIDIGIAIEIETPCNAMSSTPISIAISTPIWLLQDQ